MKRIFDFLFSLISLFICLPIFGIIAILIKLDSRGPIFFQQVYVGKGFRHFTRYKFRSKFHNESNETFKNDFSSTPLHGYTGVGRILRQFKLDELPQLLNVLKGDMSFVGPRPEVPHYVTQFRERYEEILCIRPGLMDLAFLMYVDDLTVLGKPAVKPPFPQERYLQEVVPEKIRLAKLYIEHASFLFDLLVITQTILKLFGIRPVLLKVRISAPPQAIEDTATFKFLYKYRRILLMILDVFLITLANYWAFWLRFDGEIPPHAYQLFSELLPWLILIRGVSFLVFRVNEGMWRYVSMWDVKKIVIGVLAGTVGFYGVVAVTLGLAAYPRSVYIIDSILLVGLLVGIRIAVRLFRERKVLSRMKRVLIIGAGDAGAKIVREMQSHPSCSYLPVGFIDDDTVKLGKRIHGVKVLGTRHNLRDLLPTLKPDEVLVALPGVNPLIVREITTALSPFKLQIKTLPKLEDILEGKVSINHIRDLEIEDLLQRPSVSLSTRPVAKLVQGKRVLVTGAGGSIGSELCRQIVEFGPESLILYERHENSLYGIGCELLDQGCADIIHPVLGDIADESRLESTIRKYQPHIVFHAAAHKHVPLMEVNPGEAFKNNVLGTWLLARMVQQYHVGHFVLISTDKAVNPSSVMGATKRAAELVIQGLAKNGPTCFLTVRFGNVLGSNGSVVPRFQQQIRSGGPVTVTHPEVRRYFMSIPEAVGLVLQAATLGEQGAIYLLEMGEQIKLVDLARNLIKLSGYVPDQEIGIEFVGLRPGEKLEEELVGLTEDAIPSPINGILRVQSSIAPDSTFFNSICNITAQSVLNDSQLIIKHLRQLVPTFSQNQKTEEVHSSSAHTFIQDRSFSTKKQILIVDDDQMARRAIREFLESHGYACAETDHGAMALNWLESQHADLIITDNKMPVLSGFDFLEHLKRQERTSPQLVMVLSGNLSTQDKERALNAGACAIFEKPPDFSKILLAIDQIFKNSEHNECGVSAL